VQKKSQPQLTKAGGPRQGDAQEKVGKLPKKRKNGGVRRREKESRSPQKEKTIQEMKIKEKTQRGRPPR